MGGLRGAGSRAGLRAQWVGVGGSVEPGFVDGSSARWPGCLTEHPLCYGLNCGRSDSYFEVCGQTATLFGIWVFMEIIKLKWGHQSGPRMTSVFAKGGNVETGTCGGRTACEGEGRNRGDASTRQGTPAAAGKPRGPGTGPPSEPVQGTDSAHTLILDLASRPARRC